MTSLLLTGWLVVTAVEDPPEYFHDCALEMDEAGTRTQVIDWDDKLDKMVVKYCHVRSEGGFWPCGARKRFTLEERVNTDEIVFDEKSQMMTLKTKVVRTMKICAEIVE